MFNKEFSSDRLYTTRVSRVYVLIRFSDPENLWEIPMVTNYTAILTNFRNSLRRLDLEHALMSSIHIYNFIIVSVADSGLSLACDAGVPRRVSPFI